MATCDFHQLYSKWKAQQIILGPLIASILNVVNVFPFLLSNLMYISSPLSLQMSLFCIMALAERIFLY